MDIYQLPLPSFFQFPQNDFIFDDKIKCVWEVSGKGKTLEAHTRFIACDPQHSTLYVAIMRFLSTTNSLTDCANNWCRYTGGGLQRDINMRTVMSFMANDPARTSHDIKSYHKEKNDRFLKGKITQIHSDKMNIPESQLFHSFLFHNSTNSTITYDKIQESINLKPLSEEQHIEQCQQLDIYDNDSMKVDVDSLLTVVGDYHTVTGNTTKDDAIMMDKKEELNSKCNDKDLRYIANRYVPGSLDNESNQRKVPKVVHMTSKTPCVTQNFEKNIKGWYFDDHSFFLHDDDAVDRFFNRDWPEFPLLQESLSCIVSGAGKADMALFGIMGVRWHLFRYRQLPHCQF